MYIAVEGVIRPTLYEMIAKTPTTEIDSRDVLELRFEKQPPMGV